MVAEITREVARCSGEPSELRQLSLLGRDFRTALQVVYDRTTPQLWVDYSEFGDLNFLRGTLMRLKLFQGEMSHL